MTAEFTGFGFKVDDRDQLSPGWKFNQWEQRGVPLRMELGPRDLESGNAVLVRRDTGEKTIVSQDGLGETIRRLLDDVQSALYNRALEFRESRTFTVDDYDTFQSRLDGPEPGFLWCHWCGRAECEDRVKTETKATIRCIPLDSVPEAGTCIRCGEPSSERVVFARAY